MPVVAALGIWLVNPYLGLLVSLGLQAWLLAAARLAGGRLAAAGLVLLGLLPLVVLVADLAGRFDAGLGVWHDLVLMLADGQIGWRPGAARLSAGGVGRGHRRGLGPRRPRRRLPEMKLEAGEISVRRRAPGPTGAGAGAGRREPEPDGGEPEPEPEAPEPGQPEPERDPRLWSKPRGAISPPPGSLRATPWPSVT